MKQKNTLRRSFALSRLCILAAASCALSAIANPFDGGTTNTISSDTTYGNTLYVGYFNPDNTLVVASNATLKAKSVIIGNTDDSTSNLLSVASGSLLIAGNSKTNGLTSGGIVVGQEKTAATIGINSSSALEGEFLYVGYGSNDSGRVELSGEGSELNISKDAFVGYAGSTNAVNIGNGSAMTVQGILTVGSASGSNNYVNVDGTLFVNTTNDINVVESDNDNGIKIKASGTLQVGGDVDTASIKGSGIEMASRSSLEVGGRLTLEENAIDSSLNVILNNALSTNNATWTSDSVAVIGLETGYNTLTFTNGASGVASNILQVGQGTNAKFNELNVGGSNASFTATTDVSIGNKGDNNKLNVGDGGTVDINGRLFLGNNASASGNEANIGSNGTLNVAGNVVVGLNGGGNHFNIGHGTVDAASNFIVGSKSGNNRYLQAGGTNTVSGEFIIGETKAATGKTGTATGDSVQTSGNLATVEDGAMLDLQNLTVGKEGGGSILLIRDGAEVDVAGDAVIGEAVGDNYIYLQRGSNTAFKVANDLIVGKDEGGANRFAIYGGTADIAGDLYLGSSTNQHVDKNFIHIETTNAVLNVANAIHIGASNSVNTLELAKGATANTWDLFVGAYEGVSNNTVTVGGDDSLLSVSNQLVIGSNTGSNNAVIVQNGGTLEVAQANIVIAGTNNTLTVADEGILKTLGWDFAAQTNLQTNIVFEAGSTLHLLGLLSGTNMVEGGLNFVLDGTNSSWDTGTEDLYVGKNSNENSLTITNGAKALTAANLYIGFESEDNNVTVGGAGSLLDVGMDLFVGSESNASAYNTLSVLDGANIVVGNDAYLYRAGMLKIDSTSQASIGGNYAQDEYSTLEVGVGTNNTAPNLLVAGTADLASNSTLRVYNDGLGKTDTNVVQNVVVANKLTISGETATTGLLLDRINIETNLLLSFSTSVSNNNTIVLDNFIVRSIGEAAGLEGQLLDVANEINGMITAGNSNAIAMKHVIENLTSAEEIQTAFDNYYGEKKSSTPANNVINRGLQSVSEQLTARADNTRSRMGTAGAAAPAGAAGPHLSKQELQGWITGFGTWGSQDAADGYAGYDGDITGFLLGADMSVADGILVGIAGGSGSGSISKDNSANTDTKTTFFSVYGSTGTKAWFADASLIYGGSSISTKLGSTFDTQSDTDARNIAIYVGGGKEIAGKYLIYTPQVSLLGNYYNQDAYKEQASNAVARAVDSFDAFYLQSSVGGSMAMYVGMGDITIKPELRAYWQHEWNAKEESLGYSLIDGTGANYTMFLQAPEKDILKIGIGASAKLGEYLELRADLDTRQGKNYSDMTLLGSLRYQF